MLPKCKARWRSEKVSQWSAYVQKHQQLSSKSAKSVIVAVKTTSTLCPPVGDMQSSALSIDVGTEIPDISAVLNRLSTPAGPSPADLHT